MSEEYAIIETRRVDFFRNAATGNSLIRLNFLNIDAFSDAINAADNALDDLRRAYAADLERMSAIMEMLRDRKAIDDM